MMGHLIHYFYPDLKKEELRKFSLLSLIFFLIIGSYWLLRLLKYTIFLKIAFPESLGWLPEQGRLLQPVAKFWSPLVVMGLVLIYSKLVDILKKHQLFYLLCSFYSLIFAGTAAVLFAREWLGVAAIGKWPLALAGWVSFFAIESFGSLVVALFWSFTNSITDSETAKRGFPAIVAAGQGGAIAGSCSLLFSPYIGTLWPILFFASLFVAAVIPTVHYFIKVMPPSQLVGNKEAALTEKRKEGFFEGFVSGLTLLLNRPYLLGVLVVSTFYEAISQIVEYQMQAQASMSAAYASDIAFARFMAIYGICINVLSFLIALLGTSYILKRFGVRVSLLVYPGAFFITLAALIIYFIFAQPSPTALLWLTFGAMVIIKGMGYAVNNPTKEMMYIPTSKDAKFKSKGWIDTFGSRFAKAGGAQVSNAFKYNLNQLMLYGSFFGFGLIGIWISAALYVGRKNEQLVKEGKIIE
jgi:ATP:ADP antiporter, AAA family